MQCLQTANGESDEDMLHDQVDCGNATPGQGHDPGANDSPDAEESATSQSDGRLSSIPEADEQEEDYDH